MHMLDNVSASERAASKGRKQFQFEKISCEGGSPKCKGYTIRVRGRSRHAHGLCSECTSYRTQTRRAEWKGMKDEVGVPRSATVMHGVTACCATCIQNYNYILNNEGTFTRCQAHG